MTAWEKVDIIRVLSRGSPTLHSRCERRICLFQQDDDIELQRLSDAQSEEVLLSQRNLRDGLLLHRELAPVQE